MSGDTHTCTQTTAQPHHRYRHKRTNRSADTQSTQNKNGLAGGAVATVSTLMRDFLPGPGHLVAKCHRILGGRRFAARASLTPPSLHRVRRCGCLKHQRDLGWSLVHGCVSCTLWCFQSAISRRGWRLVLRERGPGGESWLCSRRACGRRTCRHALCKIAVPLLLTTAPCGCAGPGIRSPRLLGALSAADVGAVLRLVSAMPP